MWKGKQKRLFGDFLARHVHMKLSSCNRGRGLALAPWQMEGVYLETFLISHDLRLLTSFYLFGHLRKKWSCCNIKLESIKRHLCISRSFCIQTRLNSSHLTKLEYTYLSHTIQPQKKAQSIKFVLVTFISLPSQRNRRHHHQHHIKLRAI